VRNNSNFMHAASKIMFLLAIFFAIGLILPSNAEARDVVSNSADWRDVYSTIIYSNLGGATSHFLTGTAHGPIMLYEVPQTSDMVEIVTSADRPYYVGYEALFRSRGYQNVEETIYESANLELARKLPNINKFIILDDAYGYNALAVAPYASRAGYYVIFADSQNIDDITDFLATRTVEDIIIYGHTDREVRAGLATYNPEILSSETGSRFENNMLIVDKYEEVGSIKQVILTNGEFIEQSMMSGNEPVLFIGKNNVPTEIKDYIQRKGIEIGVLIGNELIGTATDIRRQVGISVFVKFARGSRVPGGTINPVEDLDRFPMPAYQLSMSISGISYNRATGQLEVTYVNNVDLATYFITTVTLKNDLGETIGVVGDQDGAVFIDGGETRTIAYELDDIDAALFTEDMTADIYTIFGESKTSLENVIRGTLAIDTIDVRDSTDIAIVDLVYDTTKSSFYVTIENTGESDAYVQVELIDLWINGGYVTVASDEVYLLKSGEKKKIPVEIEMAEEDLTNSRNSQVSVRAVYGERKHALIKVKTAEFELKVRSFDIMQYAMIGGAVLLIILLFLFFRRKKGKKCERCRTMNDKDARVCKKCGHVLHH
jgi:archaellum component FlaF (FlaF/FlaG flagellin family)